MCVCSLEVVFPFHHSLAGTSATQRTGIFWVLLAVHFLMTKHWTPQEVLASVLHRKEPQSAWVWFSYILTAKVINQLMQWAGRVAARGLGQLRQVLKNPTVTEYQIEFAR